MADVDDYMSGKILENVELTVTFLKFIDIPILGSFIGERLLKKIKTFEPKTIDIEQTSDLILNSKKCAVGERVCRAINSDSEFTESVFLNELADGMVRVGKAQYVEKEVAINTLEKYPQNPLILAKVSNEYLELCRSAPQDCVFFRMERCKLKCLNKF